MRDPLLLRIFRIILLSGLVWSALVGLDWLIPQTGLIAPGVWVSTKDEALGWIASNFVGQGEHRQWVVAVAASGAAGLTLDEFIGQRFQDHFFPPRPGWLQWPIKDSDSSGPRYRTRLIGRRELEQRLSHWIRKSGRARSVNGAFGPRGVGKTRLIVESLESLRGWHRGRLLESIPPGTRFRRPTVVYINYSENPELFWNSFQTLIVERQTHPVRILFETMVDFEAMVAGRPADKVDLLRQYVAHHSPPKRRRRREKPADAGVGVSSSPIEKGSAQSEIQAGTAQYGEADSDAIHFVEVKPMSPDEAAILAERACEQAFPGWYNLWRAFLGRRPQALARTVAAILESSDRRPHYIMAQVRRCTAADLRNPRFDPATRLDRWIVERDEAARVVEEAVSAFPEEGLKLALIFAASIGISVESSLRHGVAPGSGDRLRLSRLLDVTRSSFEPGELFDRLPGIDSPVIAHFVLLEVAARLQRADITAMVGEIGLHPALAQRLSKVLLGVLNPSAIDGDTSYLDQFRTGVLPAVLLSMSEIDKGRWELRGPIGEAVKPRLVDRRRRGREASDSDQLSLAGDNRRERIDALAAFVEALTTEKRAMLQHRQPLDGAIAAVVLELFDEASLDARGQMLSAMARISPQLANEILLVTENDAYLAAPETSEVLRILFSPPPTQLDLEWLKAALRDDVPRAEPSPPQLIAALSGLRLMDRAFKTSAIIGWTDSEAKEVEALLTDGDVFGQMAATWACFWYVRALEVVAPPPLPEPVLSCLWALVHDDSRRVIWKRAAATVAKVQMSSADNGLDPLLDWARWIDGNRPDRPPPLQVRPAADPNARPVNLDRAGRILSSDAEPLELRRAAALLIAACATANEDRPAAVSTLVEAALLDGLADDQREMLIIRLAQLGIREADRALASLIRDLREPVTAFLALAAVGRTAVLEIDDLLAARNRNVLSAWEAISHGEARTPDSEGAATHEMGWFEIQLVKRRGHRIHKLKAKDTTGRWAYYFVLVDPAREGRFLEELEGDTTVDLEDFGRVIASNYGEEPSREVREWLYDTFGFVV